MGCTHEMKSGSVVTVVNAGGRAGGCSFCERDELRSVVEQAVVLYGIQRNEAEEAGDIQGENFWRGHRDTAMLALGQTIEGSVPS